MGLFIVYDVTSVGVTEIQIIWSIDFIERDNGVISMTTES